MMRRTDLAFVVLVISAGVLALPDNAMASPAPPEGQEIPTQGTVTITPYSAKKGNPVAVVYYRCEKGTGIVCTPHEGFYYVHNGVALGDYEPNPKDGGAHVNHVAKWENKKAKVDSLYICGAEMAAKAAEGVPVEGVHCHGDRDNPKEPNSTWRAWVVKAIYTYSVGQPITWIVDNDQDRPHNGIFKCFQKENSKDCDPDITNAGGKGTLVFWHYVNATPDNDEKNGRTAKKWEKFTLQSGLAPEKCSIGDIAIESCSPTIPPSCVKPQ